MKTNPNDSITATVLNLEDGSIPLMGLTKREYFASNFFFDEGQEMHIEYSEGLAGYRQPKLESENGKYSKESVLSIAKFWADVEAAVRVIKADALIEALNKEAE